MNTEHDHQPVSTRPVGTRRRGLLIALEGIDGAGKSTQIQRLAQALRREGLDVVTTREPTAGPHGRRLRELFSDRAALNPDEELRLFIEDRREHVATLIGPALAAGKVVLTDRYYFSTAAYQGAVGHDPAAILATNEAFAPRPDLVLLLTLPPTFGVRRVRELRGERPNDFEREDYLRRVAAIFAGFTQPCLVRIDADGRLDQVQRDIWQAVQGLLVRGKSVGNEYEHKHEQEAKNTSVSTGEHEHEHKYKHKRE